MYLSFLPEGLYHIPVVHSSARTSLFHTPPKRLEGDQEGATTGFIPEPDRPGPDDTGAYSRSPWRGETARFTGPVRPSAPLPPSSGAGWRALVLSPGLYLGTLLGGDRVRAGLQADLSPPPLNEGRHRCRKARLPASRPGNDDRRADRRFQRHGAAAGNHAYESIKSARQERRVLGE